MLYNQSLDVAGLDASGSNLSWSESEIPRLDYFALTHRIGFKFFASKANSRPEANIQYVTTKLVLKVKFIYFHNFKKKILYFKLNSTYSTFLCY
jgi:hypothetical protein